MTPPEAEASPLDVLADLKALGTAKAVAAKRGVAYWRMLRSLKGLGVVFPVRTKKLDRNRAVVACYASGKSLREAARAFAITPERVRQILESEGAPTRHPGAPARQATPCPVCGTAFVPPSARGKVCSRACAAELSRRTISHSTRTVVERTMRGRRAGETWDWLALREGMHTPGLIRMVKRYVERTGVDTTGVFVGKGHGPRT